MRILKGSITTLMGEGYMTLQVPTIALSLDGIKAEMVEAPDEWFMFVTRERLAVGREQGFLWLSPKGYRANLDALKAAWEACPTGRRRSGRYTSGREWDGNAKGWQESAAERDVSWAAFQAETEVFFSLIQENTAKEGVKAQGRAQTLLAAEMLFRNQRRRNT